MSETVRSNSIFERIEIIKNLKEYKTFKVISIDADPLPSKNWSALCSFQGKNMTVKLIDTQMEDFGFDVWGWCYDLCKEYVETGEPSDWLKL